MNTTPAIENTGLTKSYGDQEVLRGVDLTVPSGSIHALLGSNGAGKTTTVRILSTLLAALQARGGKKGMASLCIGGGEAVAMAVELP